MSKKNNTPAAKTTTMVKKNNPAALYSYYYDEGAKKAAKMGMTDRYDIKSYADKYATGKGGKKPKYGSL